MKKLLSIIGIVLAIIAIFVAILGISTSNSEIRLRNSITAQQTNCESFFDQMWKIINQKAQVSEQYKDAFKEIYPSLIDGRYKNDGGNFMKWITESNPNFDVSLYKDLQTSIESLRLSFFTEQKKLLDLDREHKNILRTFPSEIFVGGRDTVDIKIITSTETKEVYKTGEENNIELFKK